MTEERLAAIEANAKFDTVISDPMDPATPAGVARAWCAIVREMCDEVRRLRAWKARARAAARAYVDFDLAEGTTADFCAAGDALRAVLEDKP